MSWVSAKTAGSEPTPRPIHANAMTATTASTPWPAPSAPQRDDGWRFARMQDTGLGCLFELRRNVSISPKQLCLAYGLLCSLSLAVAGAFWWQGVALVMVFTGIELLAVGLAMLLVARHAGDRELITLSSSALTVEQRVGPAVQRTKFRAEWVRVEPAADDGSLVELSGEGRSVRIGRHVRPELRLQLARELRRALRLVRGAGERVSDQEQKA